MRCKHCKEKTSWDTSVGRPTYLVCNKCVAEIAKEENMPLSEVIATILHIGYDLEEQKNR